MKSFHFHVGSGRCGSTLIQALFNEPAMHQIFGQFSIQYSPTASMELGPRTPVERFDETEWQTFREAEIAPLKQSPADNIFVTQENVFGVTWEKGAENSCAANCKLITYLTEGFETKIVMLVRRQDTFIESLYNQLLKRQETRAFSDFLDDVPLANLDWAAVADTYAEQFGKENVTVLPFEKPVLATAGIDTFFEAVLRTIGLDQKINFENIPTVNPSLAPRAREIQRLANKLLSKEEAHALADWFEANVQKSPDEDHVLMAADDRARVLNFFRESNRRLCVDYMGEYETNYYLGEAS